MWIKTKWDMSYLAIQVISFARVTRRNGVI